jgi:S-adenosylmethionine synthetase
MFKTAESVTPMHPDKLCDRISDAILDKCLRQDPLSRVAVETMGGHGIITVTGEVTTNAFFDARAIVERIAPGNGVQINIVKQSPDIANGVDTGGAGDQGIMVGYACRDNDDFIPQEQYLARSLCMYLYQEFPADGKTQITLDDDGRIHTIIASFCGVKKEDISKQICNWLDAEGLISDGQQIVTHANPSGDWNQGGFEADTGVTGRKLVVDNYGPQIPLGGGAFSGKDSSKVDRSGAYKARQMAVQLLKEKRCDRCIVHIAYAIGVALPVMVTAHYLWDGEEHACVENFSPTKDLTPLAIIEDLGLRNPIFEETAEWGHFGNNFNWDK